MKLRVEVRRPDGTWAVVALPAGDGSFSHNAGDGHREVFRVEVLEREVVISRALAGIDVAVHGGEELRFISALGFEVVKRIRPGESYEMWAKPDPAPEPRLLRFTGEA